MWTFTTEYGHACHIKRTATFLSGSSISKPLNIYKQCTLLKCLPCFQNSNPEKLFNAFNYFNSKVKSLLFSILPFSMTFLYILQLCLLNPRKITTFSISNRISQK